MKSRETKADNFWNLKKLRNTKKITYSHNIIKEGG